MLAVEFAAREAKRKYQQLTLLRCVGASNHSAGSDAVLERAMDAAEPVIGERPPARVLRRQAAELLAEVSLHASRRDWPTQPRRGQGTWAWPRGT